MSCQEFTAAHLPDRETHVFVTEQGTSAGGERGDTYRLRSLDGEPVAGQRIKVTRADTPNEPYNTCVAAENGVGPELLDAWTNVDKNGKRHTFMVMDDYTYTDGPMPISTLDEFITMDHNNDEWRELDSALVTLYTLLDAAPICHLDLHKHNIVLRRNRGTLEAKAIDWEQATVGQSCVSDAFTFLLKNDVPQRVLEKLPHLTHMHRKQVARMTPRKPHHKRTFSSEQEGHSPQGRVPRTLAF